MRSEQYQFPRVEVGRSDREGDLELIELGRRHEPLDEPVQPFGAKHVRREGALEERERIDRSHVPA